MNIQLHVNARTTPAVRAEIQALKHLSTAEIARRFNISFPTAKRWKEAGDGVHDRSHRPHVIKATLDPAQEAVVLLIRETLRIGLDDLLAVVKEFIEPAMSRSALDRMLRRHKVPSLKALAQAEAKAEAEALAEKARDDAPARKGFKAYEPGFIHMDIKYLPKLEGEASRRYLFVAIDRCTRWVFSKVYDDQTEASSTDFLRRVHEACPVKIVKLLTDNGSQFTDRFTCKDKVPTGKHAFDRACVALEIDHRLIPPRTPQMNGMVERFNGRISELLRRHHVHSSANLEALLNKYVWMYNHHLPQRALGHVSPIKAMEQWQEKKSELFTKTVSTLSNLTGLDTTLGQFYEFDQVDDGKEKSGEKAQHTRSM